MDLWHQRRLLRLEDSEDPLPFGEPPLVLGHLVVTWEPIWRAAVASALAAGAEDHFTGWTWRTPLAPQAAQVLAAELGPAITALRSGGGMALPSEIADADVPDPAVVLGALTALRALLELAAARGSRVETWIG